MKNLAEIKSGEKVTVSHRNVKDSFTKRLMEMGMTDGETVTVIKSNKNIMEILVRNYTIVIRKADAEKFMVNEDEESLS